MFRGISSQYINKLRIFFSQTLFSRSEARVVQRSVDRVSPSASGVNVNALALSTHPGIASRVDLLYASRKEGKNENSINPPLPVYQ
jgi:hypothetical protein